MNGGGDQAEGNTLGQWVCLVAVRHVANGVGGGPNLAELRRSWTIDYPKQDELVLFLLRLPPQFPPLQSFLEDVVEPKLSNVD